MLGPFVLQQSFPQPYLRFRSLRAHAQSRSRVKACPIPSSPMSHGSTPHVHDVADHCKHVDWKAIYSWRALSAAEEVLATLSSVQIIAGVQLQCPLCLLLADIVPPGLQHQEGVWYLLLGLSSRYWPIREETVHSPSQLRGPCLESGDVTARLVVVKGSAPTIATPIPSENILQLRGLTLHRKCSSREHSQVCELCSGVDRMDAVAANLDLAKSWIRTCQDSHDECEATKSSMASSFPEIKLVDCQDMIVVDGKADMKYCALSYTWGSQYQNNRPTHLGDNSLPPVIRDAVTATQLLGYRYLWVDQFCIPQDNPAEKHRQIARMDTFYSHAVLTLAATSGSGAHCGIAGMGRVHRKRIGVFHQGYTVVLHRDIMAEPARTEWGSRGWTLQEELLSRRVLYFSTEQLIFRCTTTRACTATRASNLGAYFSHREFNGTRLSREVFAFGLAPDYHLVYLMRPNDIFCDTFFTIVEHYLQRRFTYENDVEFGLLGIMRKLEVDQGIFHLRGLPLKVGLRSTSATPFTALDSLCHGLLYALPWETRRRAGFPRWSWVGWIFVERRGVSAMLNPVAFGVRSFQVSVSLELQDGSMLSWSQFEAQFGGMRGPRDGTPGTENSCANLDPTNPLNYQAGLTGVLHADGWATRVRLLKRRSLFLGSFVDHDMREMSLESPSPDVCVYHLGEPAEGIYEALLICVDRRMGELWFLVVGPTEEKVGSFMVVTWMDCQVWAKTFCVRKGFRIC